MRKAAPLAAAVWRRRRFHGVSFPLPFPSPHLMTADFIGSGWGRRLTTAHSRNPFAFIFSQNQFFISRHSSTSRYPLHGRTESEEEDWGVEWEEEEDREAGIGDGGDGGGIVLGDEKWGEKALFLAREVLLSFGDDFAIYAFKLSEKGYIYVRLDKLTNRFGCPDIEEIENFNNLYKKRLDEAGKAGTIPADMALEVSSPGAERLLKVPQDLSRFQNMPMWVCYLEENQNLKLHKETTDKVLVLESIDKESECCEFKLADVKENRAKLGKGRPLNKKLKDWRIILPFKSILRIKLYLDSSKL
ncbi:uncharacterized protein LOC110039152 [Phalaenopsis equestris]|uniref:uncharacterized protein LOC110039152 n=1 Tax=Phalaenopsis equestris TaxID=78828 RepID=UPI0009E33B9A|nr:uncharacterized protein LOC110039152 [Phalaenopsis equestris]